ncbi:hypothetical protein AGMMS49965_10090 [Bacteroidia bacterium]|nr:hypothetical protein AGMMS49965_10090 [Bacteroidia bacterium]
MKDIATCEDDKYCLQPVVVKWDAVKDKWIVADGQQRLTTMYVILKALEQSVNFSFEYETRDEITGNFLRKDLFKQSNDAKFNTIDCHFIANTYKIVSEFADREKLKNNLSKVHFIWYPIAENMNDQDFFDNLNARKIQLTDAELVKALFLIDSKQPISWQQKFAVEWDMIERRLHDDKFWYFIREFHSIDKKEYPVRIELVLDLFVGLYGKEKNDNHETFVEFEKKKDDVVKLWENVYSTFAMLEEWYKDDEIFHYAGFLMSLKSSSANRLRELKDDWVKSQNKSDFKDNLSGKVSEYFTKETEEQQLFNADDNFRNAYCKVMDLKEVSDEMFKDKMGLSFMAYNDKKTKSNLYDALLLFNILELKPKNDSKEWANRFRFDLYKKKNGLKQIWSLEHIHAQNEDKDNVIHTIDNMALLTQSDNSSNSDDCFLSKRDNIRALDARGSFIPQATKNVFTKYYTLNILRDKNSDEQTWNEIDRKCYFLHLIYTFNSNLK